MADEPEPEKPEEEEAPPKASQKLWLVIIAAVLLIGIGVAYWFYSQHAKASHTEKPAAQLDAKAYLHLENFLVNLADRDGFRYLRVGIDLGLEHVPEEGADKKDLLQTAIVRDTILGVLTTWESDTLLTPEGKAKLKQQLVESLQKRLPDLGVREVYFNEFMVQR